MRITQTVLETKVKNINQILGREVFVLTYGGCYNVCVVRGSGLTSLMQGCSAKEASVCLDTIYWMVCSGWRPVK